MNLMRFWKKLPKDNDNFDAQKKYLISPIPALQDRRQFLQFLVTVPFLGFTASFGSSTSTSFDASDHARRRKFSDNLQTASDMQPVTLPKILPPTYSHYTDDELDTAQHVPLHLAQGRMCTAPCVHRLHPYDIIPCQHICYGPYGAFVCHPYDTIPCVHPVHPYDYVRCW
jgi:hypothetical protein